MCVWEYVNRWYLVWYETWETRKLLLRAFLGMQVLGIHLFYLTYSLILLKLVFLSLSRWIKDTTSFTRTLSRLGTLADCDVQLYCWRKQHELLRQRDQMLKFSKEYKETSTFVWQISPSNYKLNHWATSEKVHVFFMPLKTQRIKFTISCE